MSQIDVMINDAEYVGAFPGEHPGEVDVHIGDISLHFPNQFMIEDLRDELNKVLKAAV